MSLETASLQVGGALSDAALYIRRIADEDLLRYLRQGRYCYVIGPHQIGKSSLRRKAQTVLTAEGDSCATVDFQVLGVNVTAAEWFDALCRLVGKGLGLGIETIQRYLSDHASWTPVGRWRGFIKELVLGQIGGRVTLFFDEIQMTQHLHFPLEDFFGAIRTLFNDRADQPELLKRLTVCLIGVVNPTALMKDDHLSPFNIATPIGLLDFSREEMNGFVPALSTLPGSPTRWLNAVFHWTQGHPYLTQALLEALVLEPPTPDQDPTTVLGALAKRRFLDARPMKDGIFAFAHAWFANRTEQGNSKAQQINIYRQILANNLIKSDNRDQAQVQLLITGMVAERQVDQQSVLQARNRIFAAEFNERWVERQQTDRQLALAATHWDTSGRRPQHLYYGTSLRIARHWAHGRTDLTPLESDYLLYSQERWTQILSILIGAAAVLGMLVAAGIVVFQSREWKRAQALREMVRCSFGEGKACRKQALLLDEACMSGDDLMACQQIGHLYRSGDGTPRDVARAQLLLLRGCDGGAAESCNELGRLYEVGEHNSNQPDDERAYQFYKRACDGGDMFGCNNQGFLMEKGRGEKGLRNEPDLRGAVRLYEVSCRGGVSLACNNLGWMYHHGTGVSPDLEQAKRRYAESCDAGQGLGCLNLGLFEEEQKHAAQALVAYQKACRLDEAKGCTSLGRLHSKANNKVDAFKAYVKACNTIKPSDARGCNNLGVLLESGEGTQRDREQALVYYLRACNEKYDLGCENLKNLLKDLPKTPK